MQIWRKSNPICPACGILVEQHSAKEAFDCEAIIHSRLQDTQHVVSLLQDARTALSGQHCIARKNERRSNGQGKVRST